MGLARRSLAPRRLRLEVATWTSLGILVALFLVVAALDAGAAGEGSVIDSGRRTSAYPDDRLIDRPYGEASNGWLVFLHIIGIAYTLLGLNTVCDVYFCASLDEMVERWNIKPDVAGATFMAAGGSAPELFTSLLGTLVTQNDIGFGTIVGSAIFNVLFVIGLCGWVAKDEIELTWWPLFRDCTSYMIGLSFLAWVASDERVELWEAVMLFLLYVLYCTAMYNNGKLKAFFSSDFWQLRKVGATSAAPPVATQLVSVKPHQVEPTSPFITPVVPCAWGETDDSASRLSPCGSSERPTVAPEAEEETMATATASSTVGIASGCDDGSAAASTVTGIAVKAAKEPKTLHDSAEEPEWSVKPPKTSVASEPDREEEEKEDDDEDLMAWPTGGLKEKVLWCLSLPVYVPLYYSIPSQPKWFLVAFILSLLWIGFFSFFMVWWVEILGEVCHISPVIMGYTLLAAGTSIPDAVSSVAVARKGEGDMSVSSSIGSNIFDILVGLPIPWIIKLVADLSAGRTSEVRIRSPYLTFFVLLLLCMVFAVVLIIHCIGWRLSRKLGAFMALLYVIFLAVGVTIDSTNPSWLRF